MVAPTLLNLGLALHHQNKARNFGAAMSYLNHALEIEEKTSGPESAGAADVLVELGLMETEKRERRGLDHVRRALAIREKVLLAESPVIGLTLAPIGEAHLNLGQPLEAKPVLERACKLLQSSEGDPSNLAWARFLLARALWESGSDRERAISLAQQAHAAFIEAGRGPTQNSRQLSVWLSARQKLQADSSLGAAKYRRW